LSATDISSRPWEWNSTMAGWRQGSHCASRHEWGCVSQWHQTLLSIYSFCWSNYYLAWKLTLSNTPMREQSYQWHFHLPSLFEEAKGGFLHFGRVTISNHRAVWLDLLAQHFNMLQSLNITRPASRHHTCHDPQIVKKYNDYLVKVLETERRLQMIIEVHSNKTTNTNTDKQTTLENIDQQLTKAKLEALHHCCKLHTGHIPWTPALMQSIYKALYCTGIQKHQSVQLCKLCIFFL